MTLNEILPWLSFFLALCVTVGGALAYRQSYSKTAGEIQERVISALKTETETLRAQIADHEKELDRLRQTLDTLQTALLKRGIRVTIDGEMVMISDQSGKSSAMRNKPRQTTPPKKEEP